MRSWVRCSNGHVFHINRAETKTTENVVHVVCPKCRVETVEPVPEAVIESVKGWARTRHIHGGTVMEEMVYSRLMGCYHFTRDGIFYGVETDGEIHT